MNDIAQRAQAQAMLMQQGQMNAMRECEPLRLRQPAWAEERDVGGRLAVSLVSKMGHFLLDGVTERDPAKLALQKPAALPDGPKNDITAHVAVVGAHLARFSSRPDLPWVFGVIENDAPDALNAPGGFVFVTTGLLKKMTNEAQLAGVLAHEIGHVTNKHTLANYVVARHKQCVAAKFAAELVRSQPASSAGMLGAARFAKDFDSYDLDRADGTFSTFILDALMGVMMMSGNDSTAEFETDRAALELVTFAGYDASEYEKFLASLGDRARHPKTVERVAKLSALREGPLKDFAHGVAKPDLGQVLAPLGK